MSDKINTVVPANRFERTDSPRFAISQRRINALVWVMMLTPAMPASAVAQSGCPDVVGDINQSGVTTVVDVQCGIVVSLWELGGQVEVVPSCAGDAVDLSDVDCSGETNVIDVQIIVQLALGAPLSGQIDSNQNACHDGCELTICGNGACEPDEAEDCRTCPQDCGQCPVPVVGCQVSLDCDDGDPCTDQFCDSTIGGCVFAASGGPCDDDNPCTLADVCRSPEVAVVATSPASSNIFCKTFDFFPPACYVMTYINAYNLALAAPGGAKAAVTKTTYAGGAASIHQPQWLNDGAYGNGTSWIGEGTDNWVKIDLGALHSIDRVRLGRDRTGWYNDRDPGQIRVFVALTEAIYANGDDADDAVEYAQVVDSLDAGFSGEVSFGETIEVRFAPVEARFVKILLGGDGAAIDEIEILGAEGGSCVPGVALCDDGDSCTIDSCDAGNCSFEFAPEDPDGDGYFGCLDDCNEGDPTIYPGAPDLCDGKDNNCKGWLYPDEIDWDGDGYLQCQGDCASADPTIYPGAPEGCDGKDTNCDGQLGEAEVDWDGDGFTQCQGDCGPYDSRAYPAADTFWGSPIIQPLGLAWDFDCSGYVELEATFIGESCIGIFVCVSGVNGWDTTMPYCGDYNYYYGWCQADLSGPNPTFLCISSYDWKQQKCK